MSESQNITLLSPIKIGRQTLKNRMAMAPLTRNECHLLPATCQRWPDYQ